MRIKTIEKRVKIHTPPKSESMDQVNRRWIKEANDMKASAKAFETKRVTVK